MAGRGTVGHIGVAGGYHPGPAHGCPLCPQPKRYGSGPMLVTDGQDLLKSHADGKYYDSKSAMRRSYKNGEVKYEETGNEALSNNLPEVSEREITQQVSEAYRDLTNG
jgi:hypothetical protein